MSLEGRVALISGAAQGIGRATAQALFDDGAAVALLDLDLEAAQAAASAIDPSGERTIGVGADVRDLPAVEAAAAQAAEALGTIGILVNNAGFPKDSFLTKMPLEDWHSVLDVILDGAMHCSRTVLPGMMEQQWGRVINVSSRSHLGNPGQTNYSTAKAGLIGFTRALALEAGKFNITVNAVAPGFVETEGMLKLDNYEVLKQRSVDKSPLKRIGMPDEIAALIAFLAGDKAAYMSGDLIHATGGRYA